MTKREKRLIKSYQRGYRGLTFLFTGLTPLESIRTLTKPYRATEKPLDRL